MTFGIKKVTRHELWLMESIMPVSYKKISVPYTLKIISFCPRRWSLPDFIFIDG